jgi:hypothetical protein
MSKICVRISPKRWREFEGHGRNPAGGYLRQHNDSRSLAGEEKFVPEAASALRAKARPVDQGRAIAKRRRGLMKVARQFIAGLAFFNPSVPVDTVLKVKGFWE